MAHRDGGLLEVFENVRRGMIPAHIYNDKELFALEKERLFGRAWTFVGHESEIPHDGDYVVRRVLDDSFIITRDSAGEVRALFNMCLHRGMQVCRAEMGNASNFRCPYHGWTYRNDGRLTGLPFHREAYGGDEGFAKDQTLLPAPNFASYNGLLFISLDPNAEPLEDFLGDFRFYLDYYTKQSAGGVEVRGPQRWRIKANWKIGAENFAGDMYHTPHTHASIVEIGLFREPKAQKRKDGATYWAHRGGGTTYKLPPGGFEERMGYVGYPAEMIGRIKDVWTPQQQRVVGEDGFMISAATCFPNLSFVHNWPKVRDRDDEVLPFISIRLWQPISENETEVCSWFAVDSAAPPQYKQDSYKAYLMCFGSTGMFEQDDVENWVSLTTTAGGSMARRLLLNSRMGLLADDRPVVEPLAPNAFHGPGRAQVGYNEHNQRALLTMWADYLQGAGA
ncbi:aromatic-ring-hydroxylating dioxygenase subunit alpha [Mycobacterium intracellulare]|uniref:Hydrogenase n=2 Tax=Mycobacterium intracellulare TaxID=1767 RepID=X8AJF5_MYCIT|nr:aromatic-ring-hydroxylating dioxygenase subunit alpha [Mycobacterium intracellulare]AFC44557.1 phthalate dioxygenase large subunit [Mycobacterium intracellulare ATCC 13950]ASW96351.1 aromatic-ring-hydroxylating dioxygenase subunit alpha [Mycobacterium intracellulare]ETZ33146.1 naphthalene dioxygenase large subunit [Mycobacterium intracellulare MIN_061107_1834]EUA32022.1 naphthalene dioxygenase large subunit [Mycobacterium intracellulare]MCA2232906.1 aromatic-ring-hydroxylating dioxygenase s